MITTSEKKRQDYIKKPNKIQSLRMRKDISQIEFSGKLGLSRIYYGNIEKGIKTATPKIASEIANYLGVKVSDIFKKFDEKRFIVKA